MKKRLSWWEAANAGRWSVPSFTFTACGIVAVNRGYWYGILFFAVAIVCAYATIAQIRRGRY